MGNSTVLILGATGNTGSSIVDAILDNANFTVIAAVRPSSATKPAVAALKSRGVEIRIVDLEHASPEQLAEVLKGVEIVISTIEWNQIHLQKPLISASKIAGVKRFIPCDWGTACVRGTRKLHDDSTKKLDIHDHIRRIGLGYTFIDVGWWMQLLLPIIDPAKAFHPLFIERSKHIYGTGNVKSAVTDNRDIGKFVARIIDDERTLNRYVFVWGEEVTQNEVRDLAERVSGQKIETVHISEDAVVQMVKDSTGVAVVHAEYLFSLYIRGDNTIENAKKEEYGGALDARELYPDVKTKSLEEYAREVYLDQV